MPQVEKTKPIAGLRPEIRSTKFDNSGVFTGCLLPGVVPEILNKDVNRRNIIVQNKANLPQKDELLRPQSHD
jgi:hypothetical protein